MSAMMATATGCADVPHGLNGVGEDDLLVGLSFGFVVAAVVNEFHLLQHRRLGSVETSVSNIEDIEDEK